MNEGFFIFSVSTWNRATQGTYEPGSTFKMVTAWAGLNNNYISPETTVKDEGIYTKYEDLGYAPRCWVYPSNHGNVNVVKAIENSCNYFFYWLSDRMGITPISEAAKQFGLGSETGIEIGEKAGILASREYKREVLNEGWWNADTLQASIGQSYNQFTPVQIASYVATIANGGTHYKTSVLDYVTSSDYSDILFEKPPEIWNIIDDPGGYFPVIRRGMRAVVTTGTAAAMFKGFSVRFRMLRPRERSADSHSRRRRKGRLGIRPYPGRKGHNNGVFLRRLRLRNPRS